MCSGGGEESNRLLLLRWWSLAWREAGSSFAGLLPWVVTLVFVGRLSVESLASLSLVETWIYASLEVAWTSLPLTQSVLVSKAHGARSVAGARGWSALCFVAFIAVTCVCTACWLVTGPLLRSLGYDAASVREGVSYVYAAIPALWLNAWNLTASVFLSSIQAPSLPLAISLSCCAVDVLLTWALLFGCQPGLGLRGAALAWVAVSALEAGLYLAAVRWVVRGGRELTLGGALTEASAPLASDGAEADLQSAPLLHDDGALDSEDELLLAAAQEPPLGEFLRSRARWRVFGSLFWPNLATSVLYVFQFLVISLLAASYGKVAIAAHNSALALFWTLHALGDGMASATAVRIGFFLGAGDGAAARRAAGVALAGGAAVGGAVSLLGFSLRRYLGRVFSDDGEVGAAIESLAGVFFLSFVAACSGGVLLAVLDAQARPNAQLAAFAAGGYGVGLPLAVAAWWRGAGGIRGLWAALLAGNAVNVALGAALVWRSDWAALAAEAAAQQAEEEAEATAERAGAEAERAGLVGGDDAIAMTA